MHRQMVACFFLLITAFNVSGAVVVYAHRGGRGLWPENTLCAYEQALKLDVDFMDMDVQLSKDGVLMVTHNAGLDPNITLDDKGNWITHKTPIRELTFKELTKYHIVKGKPGTEYSKTFPNQKAMSDCHIPSLSETIDFILEKQQKKVGFQIEIKIPKKQLDNNELPIIYAKKLARLLTKKGIIARSEVQSFDFRVLTALSKLLPTLKLAFLTDKRIVKEKGGGPSFIKERTRFMLGRIRDLNGTFWEPSANDVTQVSVSLAHRLGLRVVVWGLPEDRVQERVCAQTLIDYGVDGIITDNPDLKIFNKKV